MAITKRCIVSFDMKFVASSEDVEGYTKRMLRVSRKIANGEKVSGIDLELARVAATEGIEASIELSMKSAIVGRLKDELREPQVSCGNFRVGFKR